MRWCAGRRIGIPFGSSELTCPVRALQAWLETARIVDGAGFRPLDRFQRVQLTRLSAERVALIVKRRAKAVGLDPARYAGHSLRAGLATSAAAGSGHQRVSDCRRQGFRLQAPHRCCVGAARMRFSAC
jgi:hypothetical protein